MSVELAVEFLRVTERLQLAVREGRFEELPDLVSRREALISAIESQPGGSSRLSAEARGLLAEAQKFDVQVLPLLADSLNRVNDQLDRVSEGRRLVAGYRRAVASQATAGNIIDERP